MTHTISTPSGRERVRSCIATRPPRLSALAFSLVAFASGYSYAAAPSLTLDNLVIIEGYTPLTSATGAGSIALGAGAQAKGESGADYSAIAIGAEAIADGRSTIAIGEGANVHGDRSSALGVGSNVKANRALALGADAAVTAHDAVALGQGSVADRGNTVSIGKSGNERQLVNLRAGTTDTDAVNLSQLRPVVEALGGEATINADGSVRGPNYKIDGRSFSDVGSALTNLDERAKASAQSITTLDGRVTNVEGEVKSIRVDVDDLGTRLNNGITGLVRQDPASLAISIGADKGGASVSVAGTDGTRVLTGLSNGVDDTDAVTIAQLKATGLIDPNGKQLGALAYDDLTLGRATLGGVGGTLLANVAPGMIAAGSMEAVNGGQLFTMQQKIDLLDTRLTNFENDKPAPPPPPPGGNHGNDFAQFGDGSGATGKNSIALGQNAKASGDESVALGTNSTASGKNSVALGNNSVADRDDTVSVGAPGQERQITNVKAGTAPTDAVNVQQLRDQIGGVRNDIDHYRRDASGGIASALAIANLPQASLAGESMVSIAGGTYSGQSAVAFGLSTATRNGRWVVKASGSTNTRGTVAIGAGAGYRW
ncbi:adhesin [Burkholderia sp. Bp9017]|uniref:YadA family autotransporter adhesin n=2 Tax=Burkholderia TaxID=32008 RepID=A0A7T7AH10_9BURK|nr:MULTISPECIES: YadA family autotransporter adhesin [Burkholderia]MBY4867643.1 YadA family autotransporter adhesin [Burkholderia anthina]QQK02326.1 YadA family autotransporter adhesin [Burkholderia anthina]RQZ26411.1 adhesin [Burkholderia sp. Bp9017]RQZ34243.1 adhesin [Burkholderia sp. Bp9016]